ncbi:MAG: xanthine dehydrogenase family protein molybdopterin-binding subunit [Chthoniobacterales bacterium]|nr:xanthine dehydrogenase family protein molybdopterin-binding subunit [Chthoniobacterales bacterium]
MAEEEDPSKKATGTLPGVNPPTRKMRVAVGIPGVNLAEVERNVPHDEPPALPPNEKLRVIGKRTRRLDAELKVTGVARYTADVKLPGMLHGRILRSPHAHARIRSIDTSAAERHPAVRAVHVLDTVTGGAVEREPEHAKLKATPTGGKPPLIRYVGQPIVAVAALSEAAANEALRLIKIDYEVLPSVATFEAAREANAPLVFQGPTEAEASGGGGGATKGLPQEGNVRGPTTESLFGGPRGDVSKGFAEADVTVDGEFRTQVQTHSALETHGVVADWQPNQLTVYASTQGTSGVRSDLAELFELPKSRIRVITEFMGGGFGAKFGPGNYGVAAVHLSKKAGAPVRMMLDRREEHVAVGNRPATHQKLRIGAKKDGTLTAIDLVSYGTAGVGLGAGVGWAAQAMYTCPNFKGEQYDVFTHAGPGCAFRAPGQPQGAFALEQAIDDLAEKLSLDPLALRDKIDPSPMRKEQRRIGAEKIGWAKRKPAGADAGPLQRGIGFAQSEWPRFVSMDSSCEVRITKDGSVELMSSVQDIGTGIRTVLAQVVAEELGINAEDVTVRIGDTMFPAGPSSGGSVTTGSITPAARNAAWRVRQQLLAQVAQKLKVQPEELAMADGRITPPAAAGKPMSFKEAAATLRTEQISSTASRSEDYDGDELKGMKRIRYGGVQFVQVAVDVEIGRVFVERIVAVHDCGRPMNTLQLESQINGGIIQGLSWALYENRILDAKSGVMMNANLDQYKILGARETPQIDIVILEEYFGRSSTDAGGIGEPALVATAAAVANAVYNATGVRMHDLPMNPQNVLPTLLAAASKSGAAI